MSTGESVPVAGALDGGPLALTATEDLRLACLEAVEGVLRTLWLRRMLADLAGVAVFFRPTRNVNLLRVEGLGLGMSG